MEENRQVACCGNCAYQMEKSNFYGGATCTNGDSSYYLQWVNEKNCCDEWVDKGK